MARPPKSGSGSPAQTIGHDDVARIAGILDDDRIAEILAAEPTLSELEEAAAWASGESDVMGKLRRPLTGTIARLYEILTADAAEEER